MRNWTLAVIAMVGGCVPPSNPPPQYGAQGQQGQYGQPQYAQTAQPQQPQQVSGCTQLVSCFTSCGQDGQCIQDCLKASDATSQAQVQAMMQCGSNRCNGLGAECMEVQCSAEIEACRGPVQVAQAPQQPAAQQAAEVMRPGQPHTTANLIPWLQQGDGKWIGNNHQFTFYPDGRVRRASGAVMRTDQGTYGCVSTINEEGVVRQEGDQLIMDFETNDQNHCRNPDKGPALTVRYQITWHQYSDGPVNLLLHDLGCKPGQEMYCDNQMIKR